MNIEFQQTQSVKKTISDVIVEIPADEVERDDVYGDCDSKLPLSFKDEPEEMYRLHVNPNGVVQGWPEGTTVDAYFKPRDGGRYWIVFDNEDLHRIGYYVPRCLAMGDGGNDYLELKIDGAGKIADWDRVFTPERIANDLEDDHP